MLKGMRGKGLNDAIDNAIKENFWCVTFKDYEGVTVNLVDSCVVAVWAHYIAGMVSPFISLYVISFPSMSF